MRVCPGHTVSRAHVACDLDSLLTRAQICEHYGEFELPPHKYKLLSRQRTFTIKGSRNEMLQHLNELLMLHTVGPWSHWGIVREVTCVLPARDGVRMTVCDVPGFGNERSNPFRQGAFPARYARTPLTASND